MVVYCNYSSFRSSVGSGLNKKGKRMKIMLGIPIKVEEIDNLQLALEKQYHHPKPNLCPHITLKAPIKMEGIDYNTFTRLAGVLDNASFGLHPFKIKLKGLGTFSNRVLFVKAEESEELNVLFEKINIQLEKAGFPLNKMEKERKAHITLAKEFPDGYQDS